MDSMIEEGTDGRKKYHEITVLAGKLQGRCPKRGRMGKVSDYRRKAVPISV